MSYHTRPLTAKPFFILLACLLFSHTSVLGVFSLICNKMGENGLGFCLWFFFLQLNAPKFKFVDMYFVVKNVSQRLESGSAVKALSALAENSRSLPSIHVGT